MKTTLLFRTIVFAMVSVVCVANVALNAQESNFITNEVKEGDLVISKVIYRMDGSLYRHMKYEFAYDSQKRMAAKEAFKWDGGTEKWTPYFKISYLYAGNEITMEYARWNASHKAYDDAVEKSVYELNSDNMPVAYLNYKWNQTEKNWSVILANSFNANRRLLAFDRDGRDEGAMLYLGFE